MTDTARRGWVLGGAVAAAAVAAGAGLSWWRLRPDSAATQASALFFGQTLPDAAGQPVPLQRFAGQPLIVNFWATWCPPCVEEMPELSELHHELQPRGLRMVGIGIDSPEKIAEFAAKRPVSYPLLVAGMGGTELGRQFGNSVGALPFTVLIAPSGAVAQRILGRVDIVRLRSMALALIG
jgi:peroxiredoxin